MGRWGSGERAGGLPPSRRAQRSGSPLPAASPPWGPRPRRRTATRTSKRARARIDRPPIRALRTSAPRRAERCRGCGGGRHRGRSHPTLRSSPVRPRRATAAATRVCAPSTAARGRLPGQRQLSGGIRVQHSLYGIRSMLEQGLELPGDRRLRDRLHRGSGVPADDLQLRNRHMPPAVRKRSPERVQRKHDQRSRDESVLHRVQRPQQQPRLREPPVHRAGGDLQEGLRGSGLQQHRGLQRLREHRRVSVTIRESRPRHGTRSSCV